MFSSGNITEKMRVAKFDCTGQVVVDLYAGIGYYTLPYLVHAKGMVIIASCEMAKMIWTAYLLCHSLYDVFRVENRLMF